jgi:hypothetical protein
MMGLRRRAPNSQAIPVTGLRLRSSAIVACFVLWRKISRRAFWDFCNTIGTKQTSESVYECLLSGVKRTKRALAITRFSGLNSEVRYAMEKVPGHDMWAVIDTVTQRPALVNDVPQIDLGLDDADDLTDLLNRLDREASVGAKH